MSEYPGYQRSTEGLKPASARASARASAEAASVNFLDIRLQQKLRFSQNFGKKTEALGKIHKLWQKPPKLWLYKYEIFGVNSSFGTRQKLR